MDKPTHLQGKSSLFLLCLIAGPWLTPMGNYHVATAPVPQAKLLPTVAVVLVLTLSHIWKRIKSVTAAWCTGQ